MKTVMKISTNHPELPGKLSNVTARIEKFKTSWCIVAILIFLCASSVRAQSKLSITDFSKENPKKDKAKNGDSVYVLRKLAISEKIDSAQKNGIVQVHEIRPGAIRSAKEKQVIDSILIQPRRTFNKSEVPVARKSEIDRWSKKKE